MLAITNCGNLFASLIINFGTQNLMRASFVNSVAGRVGIHVTLIISYNDDDLF